MQKSELIRSIRGMNDVLPSEAHYWEFLEENLKNLAKSYGYLEIKTPVLESTELFERSIGDVTDIVEKEMYTFEDRNGDSLSLRPEGTASVVRAGLEHGLFYNQTQKVFYMGPMYRHERPQKGRYRQFYQFGLEAFGFDSPVVEAEMMAWASRLFKNLGVIKNLKLEINTLGETSEREVYRAALIKYFEIEKNRKILAQDVEAENRLYKNPMRILDSKNNLLKDLISQAPRLINYLSEKSLERYELFKQCLNNLNIKFVENESLVRGLDYYTHTVFEWTTEALGAQGTVLAGGRYDNLVQQLGGQNVPAVGCALGVERILLLQEVLGAQSQINSIDIFWVVMGEASLVKALVLAEELKNAYPKLKIEINFSQGGFKSQFKKADKSGAKFALVLGEDELSSQQVILKFLREERPQINLMWNELVNFFENNLIIK